MKESVERQEGASQTHESDEERSGANRSANLHHPTDCNYALDARRYQTQSAKAIMPTITISCMSNKVASESMVFAAKKPLKKTALDIDVTELENVSSGWLGISLHYSYTDIWMGR